MFKAISRNYHVQHQDLISGMDLSGISSSLELDWFDPYDLKLM